MKKIRSTMKPKPPIKMYLGSISDDEKLFLMLMALLGMTAQQAFRLAFPTRANATSCCAMASKLLADRRLQDAAWKLANLHDAGKLVFNDRILKSTP